MTQSIPITAPGNAFPTFLQSHGGALSPFNTIAFIVSQMLAGVSTVLVVEVKSVIAGTGLLPGTVNVQPLVNQLTPDGTPFPHGTIFDIPFIRLQGGGNAIICDPVVGDQGIIVVATRDITNVKKNGGVQNPGSRRKFSPSDGIYIGGWGNQAPTQYVQFLSPEGIKVVDAVGNTIVLSAAGILIRDVTGNMITMNSSGIAIQDTNGNSITLSSLGDKFTSGGVTVGGTTHTHPDPQGGNTGAPNPGS